MGSGNSLRIGIDLDNTIICYDTLIHKLAVEHGYINPGTLASKNSMSKNMVRDSIRFNHDGEQQWQKLQAQVYGSSIMRATPMKGIEQFLRLCDTNKSKVFIVSHKTTYANIDSKTNLREAALNWLKHHKLIGSDDSPIAVENVYFEDTKIEKVKRISRIDCTHYIDDLYDILVHTAFPVETSKMWLSRDSRNSENSKVKKYCNWDEITQYFLHSFSTHSK